MKKSCPAGIRTRDPKLKTEDILQKKRPMHPDKSLNHHKEYKYKLEFYP